MRRSQLTQWVVVVSLTACSDAVRPASGFGLGEMPAGAGDSGDSSTPPDAMALSESGAIGTVGDAGILDGAPDSTNSVRADVTVMQGESGSAECSNDRAALGSGTLVAGGATPAAFAAAFNAELLKLPTPGPFLMIFAGVNQGSSAPKTATFGALSVTAGGVDFAGAHADVPFSMGPSGLVQIPKSDASFELRFIAPASDANIPVASVELSGTMGNSCVSLTITSLRFLVPGTASAIAFHGSTVGDLMGAATASVQGGSNNAWPLEISGKVKEVSAAMSYDAGGGPL